jgi:RNA polymerase sigma factor (TIGR02999 family)
MSGVAVVTGPQSGEVTRLLLSWSRGDRSALDELTPLVHSELRRLAAAYLRRERRSHTLQATALVNEVYVRLIDQAQVQSGSRAHFFGIAANLMRQILINHAKRHGSLKRGGQHRQVMLTDVSAVIDRPQVDLLALDEALNELARLDPRQSQVVELRFFGGLGEDEAAEVLGVSPVTVKRDWRMAKAFLLKQLSP